MIDGVLGVMQGGEQNGMSISLPRVNSAELLLFPETAEGHVSKVLHTACLHTLLLDLALFLCSISMLLCSLVSQKRQAAEDSSSLPSPG